MKSSNKSEEINKIKILLYWINFNGATIIIKLPTVIKRIKNNKKPEAKPNKYMLAIIEYNNNIEAIIFVN
jgi:hypothetical protein